MKQELISLHTKELLAEALKRRALKKPLNKITVSELIEECNINRRTFYYHFEDIYDLYEWTLHQEAGKWFRQDNRYRTLDEGLRLLLDFLRENQVLCSRAIDGLGREKLRHFLYSDAMNMGRTVINEQSEGLEVPEKARNFITEFYTGAVAGSVMLWIENGMIQPPEEFLSLIHISLYKSIRAALEQAADSSL